MVVGMAGRLGKWAVEGIASFGGMCHLDPAFGMHQQLCFAAFVAGIAVLGNVGDRRVAVDSEVGVSGAPCRVITVKRYQVP
eukprot:CAMPEP_0182929842 /NCGR_PEP_ID=MMETSP0105_2-20130417/22886_1 /TAXON_ID=81532 ORGANISM="Acanthoeca-like sp., Strain 10tr" /NCGR_SAMPLE_ID=MMETSP0105_2 /ASSEMBLY_ACC=CAM_ASM_000205 /LENGTH=80 /DNA_ID=CAMNT_0025068039 /DNA_START=253 /DNA_END=495 /DNA_ORIENTATION=+